MVNVLLLFIFPFVNFSMLKKYICQCRKVKPRKEECGWWKVNVITVVYWKETSISFAILKVQLFVFHRISTSLENYITLILQKNKTKKKLHRRIRVLGERQKVCNFISFLLFDKLINSFCRWNKMHDLSPSHNGQTDLPDPQSVCGSSPLSAV